MPNNPNRSANFSSSSTPKISSPPNTLSSSELNKVTNKQSSSFFDRLFSIVPPQWLGSILAVFLYGFYWSFAGSLTPPTGTPSSTMNNLGDIYNIFSGSEYSSGSFVANENGNINEQLKYIIENLGYTFGDSNPDFVLTTADGAGNALGDTNPAKVLTTASAAGTYNATNLTPANVAQGVSFGVGQVGTLEEGYEYGDNNPNQVLNTADGAGNAYGSVNPEFVTATSEQAPGTLLYNLTHGRNTANTFDVDDLNAGGAPATGRYATSWTQCTSANSRCGTSDNRASARDDVTGLIWSYPCSGTNCSNMTNETADTYNHATALTNCSSKSPWRLPTQKELLQAYINGAYGNDALEPQGTSRYYWSATTASNNTNLAWLVYLSYGLTDNPFKTGIGVVRCVRSAV